MHVDVIAVGVKARVEYQWCVHERTRIHEAASLTNLHLFHIEDETSIEDVESCGALATEQKNLVVSDLVRQSHVRRHPVGLGNLGPADLLPDISRNVVNFDRIDNALLVDPATKCKDVVVLEDAERRASTWDAHVGDELPLVLLGVIDLAVAVHLIAHERSNHIDEVLDGANRMICVWVVHVRNWIKDSKKIIVSVAILQVDAHMLDVAASEVDCAGFGRDRARVEWNIVSHLHGLLFECLRLETVQLDALLVPLERMQALRVLRAKTTLDVVINSQIALDHVCEIAHNLIRILV